MYEVDKWMGQFNTTTQSLNTWLSNHLDERLKNYVGNLFTILVGNLKLQISLDQRVILQDNHLIDSGLIRALFRYSNDPAMSRMLREFKNLMLTYSDHFIYVHDNRINKTSATSLIADRFNLTANRNYVHSAAFGDENWSDISDQHGLEKSVPEYEHIFYFLTEFVERIPGEHIVSNPQQDDIYIELLKTDYENNKDKYDDYVATQLRICIDKYSNDSLVLNRSGLYDHFDQSLGSNNALVAKRLIADQIYSFIVPKSLESQNFNVDTTELATIFTNQDLKRVFKEEVLRDQKKHGIKTLDLTSDNCLANKQNVYQLIASLTVEEIGQVRSLVRSQKIYNEDADKIVSKVLYELYRIHKERKSSSLKSFQDISASIKILPESQVSTIIPVKSIDRLSFLYTKHFNKGWKDLSDKVDRAMSGNLK